MLKVLRDVALRPNLVDAVIRIDERRVLDSQPPKEGVMPNERCDLAVGAAHGDTSVNAPGEMRDTILDVVVRDLHNVYQSN